MVVCFLPYLSFDDYSMNYVYTKSSLSTGINLKDGIFVLIFGFISLLTLFIGKKKIPPLVFQSLSFGVFLYDYFDTKNNTIISTLNKYLDSKIRFDIGFYLLFVFLIISVILSIIRVVKKDKYV